MKDRDLDRRGLGRREFLKTSGLGIMSAAFGLRRASDVVRTEATPVVSYGTLGRTGLEVSRIGVGGGRVSLPCVQAAIDRGINLLHTAWGYGGGETLRTYAQALERGRRDKIVLAYKGVVEIPGRKPEPLATQVDAALDAMKTDRIDLLLCNCHNTEIIGQSWIPESFRKIKEQGKARFLGFSCHKSMSDVLSKAVDLAWYDAALVAYREPGPAFPEATARAKKSGMGIIAMKGLTPEIGKDPAAIRAATLEILAKQNADSMLVVMDTMDKVNLFAEIATVPDATAAEKQALRKARQAEEGKICLMCGACKVCPRGVDPCTVIRYKMYYEDYGRRDEALQKYRSLPYRMRADNCDECGKCETVCRGRLPVRLLLTKSRRLFA